MNMEQEAQALQKLKGAALRSKYREVVGSDTKSNNRPYLIKRILQAMHTREPERASPTTNEDATAEPAPAETPPNPTKPKVSAKRERDSRIPAVGTVLEREYDGKMLRVKVLEDGFQFRGKTYRSLSAIAKEATGTIWNGLLFFNLIKRTKTTTA
jgi:hypothetical protein